MFNPHLCLYTKALVIFLLFLFRTVTCGGWPQGSQSDCAFAKAGTAKYKVIWR